MLIIVIVLLFPLIACSQSNIVPTIIGNDTLYCMPKERLSLISNRLVELNFEVDSLKLELDKTPYYQAIINNKKQQIESLERINKGYIEVENLNREMLLKKDEIINNAGKVMDGYILDLQKQKELNLKLKKKHRKVSGALWGIIGGLAVTTVVLSLK